MRAAGLALGSAFGLGGDFGHFRGHGFGDFEVGQFEFAQEIEEHVVFFGSEVAFCFLLEGIEHVDEFASGFGINHGLTGIWVGVCAQNHGGIAADHADEIFESGKFFGGVDERLGAFRAGVGGGLGFGFYFFAACFALLLFNDVFADFTFGSERTAVNYLEAFVFVVGHAGYLARGVRHKFSMGGEGVEGGRQEEEGFGGRGVEQLWKRDVLFF